MPATVMASNCRLTVLTPRTRVDLAVPVDMPIGELLANLVSGLGPAVADDGIDHGALVLQRLGEKPPDPAGSLSSLAITDGEVLHLVPRAQQLPEIAYDDVLDAVGSGVLDQTARWSPRHTRRGLVGFGLVAFGWSLGVTMLSGPSWLVPCVVLGAVAVLLLGVSRALSRTMENNTPAVLSAAAAVAFAAGSAATGTSDGSFRNFGATQLMPACGAAVVAAVLALVLIGSGLPLFVAVITAGVLGTIGGGSSVINSLGVAGAAALTAGIALALSPFVPLLSFRLSRLTLPPIVSNAADLRADTATIDGRTVLGQAARADQIMTGLVGAIGLSIAISGLLLATPTDDLAARILAAVLAVACLLRARVFSGVWQRIGLLSAAGVVGAALLGRLAVDATDTARLLIFVAPVLVAGMIVLGMCAVVPGRKLIPTWGRLADVLETLLVLSVIPLVLGMVGVYGAIRGISNQ